MKMFYNLGTRFQKYLFVLCCRVCVSDGAEYRVDTKQLT